MELLAVKEGFRGQGTGAHLLEAVEKLGVAEGYGSISLEVVDSNPEARRLYQRFGYEVEKIQQFPFLQPIMGFSASIHMRKKT